MDRSPIIGPYAYRIDRGSRGGVDRNRVGLLRPAAEVGREALDVLRATLADRAQGPSGPPAHADAARPERQARRGARRSRPGVALRTHRGAADHQLRTGGLPAASVGSGAADDTAPVQRALALGRRPCRAAHPAAVHAAAAGAGNLPYRAVRPRGAAGV